MFAGQYFAQWYFAGNPFEVVPPPPPPPPPVVERCYLFAVGECVGEASELSPAQQVGRSQCIPTAGRAIGVMGG